MDKQLIKQHIEIAKIKKIEQEVIIEKLSDMLEDKDQVITYGKDFTDELKSLCKLHNVRIVIINGQLSIYHGYKDYDIYNVIDYRIKNCQGTSSI